MNTNLLTKALQTATDNGVTKPVYRIGRFRITLAPTFRKDGSKGTNPGALYVKDRDYQYVGKINADGTFRLNSTVTGVELVELQCAVELPEVTALRHGKETGECCCCGRTLTNPLSIELGIGPICRGYYFPDTVVQPDTNERLLTEALCGKPEDYLEFDDLGHVIPTKLPTSDLMDLMDLEPVPPIPEIYPELPVPSTEVDDLLDLFVQLETKQQLLFVHKLAFRIIGDE